MITLPHFSPGQGKCPGWWTSTWWAFIFPENFVLKIGSFDNFSIYQMITFPRIKVHKSSKTFFNDYRCCQNKNKNGNRQQWNLWDDGDPWYGFSSRFSINHQIEEHGNHQQSHSDPWFGFSLRFSINHHEEEYVSKVTVTATHGIDLHQDFPPFVKNLFPHSGHGTPWPFGGTLAII